MKLENKVAIVTGAGSGMGKAIAGLFAKEGAKVIASDINETGVKDLIASSGDINCFFSDGCLKPKSGGNYD